MKLLSIIIFFFHCGLSPLMKLSMSLITWSRVSGSVGIASGVGGGLISIGIEVIPSWTVAWPSGFWDDMIPRMPWPVTASGQCRNTCTMFLKHDFRLDVLPSMCLSAKIKCKPHFSLSAAAWSSFPRHHFYVIFNVTVFCSHFTKIIALSHSCPWAQKVALVMSRPSALDCSSLRAPRSKGGRAFV